MYNIIVIAHWQWNLLGTVSRKKQVAQTNLTKEMDQKDQEVNINVKNDKNDDAWFSSMVNTTQNEYGEEVIGHGVEIYFLDSDQRNGNFYQGKVIYVQRGVEDIDPEEATSYNEHFVVFEDGDSRWFNLKEQEEQNEL